MITESKTVSTSTARTTMLERTSARKSTAHVDCVTSMRSASMPAAGMCKVAFHASGLTSDSIRCRCYCRQLQTTIVVALSENVRSEELCAVRLRNCSRGRAGTPEPCARFACRLAPRQHSRHEGCGQFVHASFRCDWLKCGKCGQAYRGSWSAPAVQHSQLVSQGSIDRNMALTRQSKSFALCRNRTVQKA